MYSIHTYIFQHIFFVHDRHICQYYYMIILQDYKIVFFFTFLFWNYLRFIQNLTYYLKNGHSTVLKSDDSMQLRYRPRFFDQVGHQTTSSYIENEHFFTKSCHPQTYHNYEQPPQRLQNSYFQSHFSSSKIKKESFWINF